MVAPNRYIITRRRSINVANALTNKVAAAIPTDRPDAVLSIRVPSNLVTVPPSVITIIEGKIAALLSQSGVFRVALDVNYRASRFFTVMSDTAASADSSIVSTDADVTSGGGGDISVQADDATTASDGDLLHASVVASVASPADIESDSTAIRVGSSESQCDSATSVVVLSRVRDADAVMQSGVASGAASGDVVHAAALTAQALK